MHFEVHLTVLSNVVGKFSEDCKKLNVKPIVIEVENGECIQYQVMTSSKHIAPSFEDTLMYLTDSLTDLGYKVVRQKVEIQPEFFRKHKDFIYYETHFRLKLPKLYERNNLIVLCKNYNFHLSKNLFKSDNEFDYQMITFRDSSIDYDSFKKHIDEMKKELNLLNIEYDKVEIEECIYDSNISIDKNWLSLSQ